jgi:hypothetical protein
MRDSYLSKYYWRIKQRRGGKKAIIALSRKILVIIYNLLKNKDTYNEDKFEAAKQKCEAVRFKRVQADAKKLGFTLIQAEQTS